MLSAQTLESDIRRILMVAGALYLVYPLGIFINYYVAPTYHAVQNWYILNEDEILRFCADVVDCPTATLGLICLLLWFLIWKPVARRILRAWVQVKEGEGTESEQGPGQDVTGEGGLENAEMGDGVSQGQAGVRRSTWKV